MASYEPRADTTTVDIRVVFAWRAVGAIGLDRAGKLRFPSMAKECGAYRMTLTGAPGETRPRVYIGEGGPIPRRLQRYRTPGISVTTKKKCRATG